jgi:hypothetical protein
MFIANGMSDIVSMHFDTGVHLGGQVRKDMVTVRIRQDIPASADPWQFDGMAIRAKSTPMSKGNADSTSAPTSSKRLFVDAVRSDAQP